MSTADENVKTKYIFRYDVNTGELIAHKKNLIDAIKAHDKGKTSEIRDFSTESVTDKRFNDFLDIAKRNGYTVYEVTEP